MEPSAVGFSGITIYVFPSMSIWKILFRSEPRGRKRRGRHCQEGRDLLDAAAPGGGTCRVSGGGAKAGADDTLFGRQAAKGLHAQGKDEVQQNVEYCQ